MIYPKEHLRFIKDIGRCPYSPNEPGYVSWMEAEEDRLLRVEKERQKHIEALEADGFFILAHNEAAELSKELVYSNLNINHFAATRAVRRLLDLFYPDYVKR